ncbi:MAG: hypothetical protein ABFD86_13060 [Bryobacteraceae bacterium]
MRRNHSRRAAILLCLAATLAFPQAQDEDFRVFAEHPRLFLRAQRLRLLRRERQRRSMRWEKFETLMAGKARMPEPGLSAALYAQVTQDWSACRPAVEWALTSAADLRQQALVFDWCQPSLGENESRQLAARLERGIAAVRSSTDLADVRSRVLAAVALAGHSDPLAERELRSIVVDWWRGKVIPSIKSGHSPIPLNRTYDLFELLHAVRDNINIELREALPAVFKELPIVHVLSHYPATYPAPEGEYRIQAFKGGGEPDLTQAARSRAAGLAMVAYDTNAQENQFLQGWLIQDRFLLQSPFGVPYEFLWANPYQPGLSPFYMPLYAYDELAGRVFVRSSWEEDAAWFGYFDGESQKFDKGRIEVLSPQSAAGVEIGPALIFQAAKQRKFRAEPRDIELVFVLGLQPGVRYDVEVEHEEMREERAGPGGILRMLTSGKFTGGLRLKPAAGPSGN